MHCAQLRYKDSLLVVMGRSRRQVPKKACFGCMIRKAMKIKFTGLAVSDGLIDCIPVINDATAKLGGDK